jgi:uncharacterized membrane protein YphA (DoxX/SURF4 family)
VNSNPTTHNLWANGPLILRIGLGLVFVIGGLNKLSQLLNPALQDKILTSYWGASGYVNQFIVDVIFEPLQISHWWFLTSLSTFELLSGIALIVGFAVRPLSFFYGFLLWTFVIALPVITVPGIEVSLKTYTAPALLVQIRDVALSGMMFVLYNIGAGAYSLDNRLFGVPNASNEPNWNALALLLRISIALPLGIGAVFYGMPNISSFATTPWILLPIAIFIAGNVGLRYAAIALMLIMFWYMAQKFNLEKSMIGNLNGFKREFAFIAGGAVLALFGGGVSHSFNSLLTAVTKRIMPKKMLVTSTSNDV